ncbi:PDZK1-interacting protein 1 isoform X2 [Takifugu rubripes]|uniref:PDZK1-interacting protein 1 isoform X2 n=1 Tax=Takifugu rubripes TaxID=31033 RepID=UPI00114585DF|nr:small integral membrane protein 24 isoform X2 [Takifugu rubripes]
MIYLRTPADLISRSDASRLQSSGSSSESTMKNRAEICCLLLMVAAVAAQTGTAQTGTVAAQTGTAQTGTAQTGTVAAQTGTAQTGTAQTGTAQTGTAQTGTVAAQTGTAQTGTAQTERSQAERALPQWLTGIIAVAGFLLLAFVALLVNRAWCGKSSYKDVESDERRSEATYDTSLNTLSSKGIDNAYANVAFSADEKVTAM